MRAVSSQLDLLSDEEGGRGKTTVERASRHDRDPLAQRISAYVKQQPAGMIFTVGVALVALVGWADYVAGDGLAFTPFYLVPVALVTWLLGRRAGVAIALVATLSWSLAYVYGGPGAQWETIVPYWNIAVQMGIFMAGSLILSGFREGLEHEKELARTDPITGAPNSRAFFEHLDHELDRSLRYGHPFTVAYLDADNFKEINDKFGHTVGDNLLRVVAGVVGGNIRSTDLVARIAGDEFTLLLPETGRKEAELVAARVSKALAAAMESNGWPVTFSIGVVTYNSPPPTLNALVKIADDVMYSVKRNGKNAVRHRDYGERQGAA